MNVCRDWLPVSAFISLQDFAPCFLLTTYIKLLCQFLNLNISVSNIHALWRGINLEMWWQLNSIFTFFSVKCCQFVLLMKLPEISCYPKTFLLCLHSEYQSSVLLALPYHKLTPERVTVFLSFHEAYLLLFWSNSSENINILPKFSGDLEDASISVSPSYLAFSALDLESFSLALQNCF
jgi:hypothetical protein